MTFQVIRMIIVTIQVIRMAVVLNAVREDTGLGIATTDL